MAKLPALISALAQVDGRERKAVDHIGRTIRERGYITTGKRGHGAAEMTTAEAVNLIIALNGSDSPKDAPIAIDRFRSLLQMPYGSTKTLGQRLENYESYAQPIKDVMNVHTFGEALDALVEGVPDLVAALYQYMETAYTQVERANLDGLLMSFLRLGVFGIEVTFHRYHAKIELYRNEGATRYTDYFTEFVQDDTRIEDGFYGKGSSDRRVSVAIGTRTLIAAWQALHPGEKLRGVPDLLPSHEEEVEAFSEE